MALLSGLNDAVVYIDKRCFGFQSGVSGTKSTLSEPRLSYSGLSFCFTPCINAARELTAGYLLLGPCTSQLEAEHPRRAFDTEMAEANSRHPLHNKVTE